MVFIKYAWLLLNKKYLFWSGFVNFAGDFFFFFAKASIIKGLSHMQHLLRCLIQHGSSSYALAAIEIYSWNKINY